LVYLGALLFDLIDGCPEHANPIRDSLKKKLEAGVPIEEYKPFGVPIAVELALEGQTFYTAKGTINGQFAYSNGHILLFGECPWADAKQTEMQKLWDRSIEGPVAEVWPRLLIYADEMTTHNPIVLFSDESTYNLRYYDHLVHRFPSARYFKSAAKPFGTLVIHNDGEPVALLQSLRYAESIEKKYQVTPK
jgi:hypothetical protein